MPAEFVYLSAELYCKSNVAACEEFVLLLTEAHILAAAMTTFGMDDLDSTPTHELFSTPTGDSARQRDVLLQATRLVIDKFVDIAFACGDEGEQGKGKRKRKTTVTPGPKDDVQAYASEVLSLGLLLMEFVDGIREGDGDRIIRCWHYMMLLFKANGRKNYSIEALNLLLQLNYTLSPRMAAQLTWNRTVNVHGRPGKNVSSDLRMEHLNRECKNSISGMGAN